MPKLAALMDEAEAEVRSEHLIALLPHGGSSLPELPQLLWARAWIEQDIEHGLQLDGVRRHAPLAVVKVEESHAHDSHRRTGVLEVACGLKRGVELVSRFRDRLEKRTIVSHAVGERDLRDDRVARLVGEDEVIVGVARL